MRKMLKIIRVKIILNPSGTRDRAVDNDKANVRTKIGRSSARWMSVDDD